MSSGFDHYPLLHYRNLVRVLDGRKAVSDDDRGPPLFRRVKCGLNDLRDDELRHCF